MWRASTSCKDWIPRYIENSSFEETVMPPASPADIAAQGDPGDETARRYFYQWSYTAILACGLLELNGEITEIFCEHHDDILAK